MEFIDVLGLVAGICTTSSIIPQIVKTVKKKKAEEVSLFMFVVLMVGNSLWVYYGFSKSDFAITSTNLLSIGLNLTMLVLKFIYRHNK